MPPKSRVDKPSMLLRFSGENIRSFRDSFELSLMATRMAEPDVSREIPWRDGGSPIMVLPAAGIFGANASGKTNLLRAMEDMRGVVVHSFRSGTMDSRMVRRPFQLGTSRKTPTRLEVDLVVRGVRHEYGFVFDDEHVLNEWAYSYPHGRRALLFERDEMKVSFGSSDRAKGRVVSELLRPNALYLSTAAAADFRPLAGLNQWFLDNMLLADAANRHVRHAQTIKMLESKPDRAHVLDLLKVADLGISDARMSKLDPELQAKIRRALRILTDEADGEKAEPEFPLDAFGAIRLSHTGPDGAFELDPDEESLGTVVWLGLVGPILEALRQGAVLLADELDSSLHPRLVQETVRLFQDQAANPLGAQLIFNAFDLAILGDNASQRILGRDQVWFTEKSNDGATKVFPLADYSPRKEEAIASRYLSGRYGAVPIITHSEFQDAVGFEDQVELVNQ